MRIGRHLGAWPVYKAARAGRVLKFPHWISNAASYTLCARPGGNSCGGRNSARVACPARRADDRPHDVRPSHDVRAWQGGVASKPGGRRRGADVPARIPAADRAPVRAAVDAQGVRTREQADAHARLCGGPRAPSFWRAGADRRSVQSRPLARTDGGGARNVSAAGLGGHFVQRAVRSSAHHALRTGLFGCGAWMPG